MNSNVRLQLSSLLSKEQGDMRLGRAFGKELTNDSGVAKQATFFRHKSFVGEHPQREEETVEKEPKTAIQHQQPAISNPQLNPQLTAYYEEIVCYLAERELARQHCNPAYLESGEVTSRMRASLADWLVDVHLGFKLLPQTLFKTTAIVDKYLASTHTSFKRLQLVGVAALLIACKYEEIYPPSIRSFAELVRKQHSLEDIVDMEGKILKALDFDLTFPTSAVHLEHLIETQGLPLKEASFSWYLLELALLDHAFLKYSQSTIAAASVFLMRVIYKRALTTKVSDECKHCAKQLVLNLQNATKSPLQASRIKYSAKQFAEVSRLTIRPTNQ